MVMLRTDCGKELSGSVSTVLSRGMMGVLA